MPFDWKQLSELARNLAREADSGRFRLADARSVEAIRGRTPLLQRVRLRSILCLQFP
jgi:hypothetical protein